MTTLRQKPVACFAIALSCLPLSTISYGQAAPAPELNMVVVEGQGVLNNIRQRTGRNLAVRMENESRQPVAGVPVVFTLPSQGAGGSFANGEKTLIVNTDEQGQAVARGLKPNNVAGRFDVRVSASHQGRTASTTITQFNMAVQNTAAKGNTKWIVILLAAGGAGAAGAVLGTRGSSGSSRPSTPTAPATVTISAGSGTVGPPQ